MVWSFVVGILLGSVVAGGIIYKKLRKKYISEAFAHKKFFSMYAMLERWLYCIHAGRNIEDYLKDRNIHNIAIYGCGDIGKLLYEAFKETSINVICGIDRNAAIDFPVEVKHNDEKICGIDAIIVTSIAYYYDIEEKLKENVDCQIISLENIIYEVAY